jgi:hypothetical protein
MMSKKSTFMMHAAHLNDSRSASFNLICKLSHSGAGKQAHGIFMGGRAGERTAANDVTSQRDKGAKCNERLSPQRGSFYLYASSFLRLPRSKPFPLHSSHRRVCLCVWLAG